VALPFSPPWLLGVFAHRTELLGLVDPAPLLLGAARGAVRDPSAPPPAATLIVGHDDQMLGLAVEALGEIVLIRPDEIAATSGEPMDETSVAPPYLRGYYQPPAADDAVAYAVVDLEPFVATLLDALREGVAHG
jgi:chemotaxis signal transduction protein